MNRIKSFLNFAVLAIILSAGLVACKGSKKAADASKEPTENKPIAVIKDDEPEITEEVNTEAEIKKDLRIRVDNYFKDIVEAPNNSTLVERRIYDAKALFASGDVPVFIVIYKSPDGTKDYDEPTTIAAYLNYLKDTGKYLNDVSAVKINDNGKITELELIRK